jgi:CopG family nickel-responsive transcriptional regulator
VLTTVTAVFGYDEPEIGRRAMEVGHESDTPMLSNSHNYLESDAGCVETFVVEATHCDDVRFIGTVREAD